MASLPKWGVIAQKKLGVSLHHHSHGELHGPCPHCGGTKRFIVWSSGKAWCRECNRIEVWINGAASQTAVAEASAQRVSRGWLAATKMAGCTDWVGYHKRCLDDNLAQHLWAESGIDLQTIKKWGLGWVDKCPVYPKSPALTIPVFGSNGLLDIRHRLVDPPLAGGKYRSHVPGLLPYLFNGGVLRNPWSLVVEGEKKAIVLDKFGIPAAGISGVGNPALLDAASKYNFSVTIALDPGVEKQARIMAQELMKRGQRVRIAYFLLKPDDFILKYGLDVTLEVLRQAREI